MKITKEIISKEIEKMKNYYSNFESLFIKCLPNLPEHKKIDIILNKFREILEKNEYPDLLKEKELTGLNNDSQTIYMFFMDSFPYEKKKIEDKFNETKELEKLKGNKLSLCRINDSGKWENAKNGEQVCLYVGSSKNIKKRLKEHLFCCNKESYAMHLDTWFYENDKEKHITIYIWDFSNFFDCDNNKNLEYLQTIEDLLWNNYEPLFGRQGKK